MRIFMQESWVCEASVKWVFSAFCIHYCCQNKNVCKGNWNVCGNCGMTFFFFFLFFCKHHCYPKWEILHEEIWLWQVWNEYFLHFVSIIISQRMGNLNFVCTSLSSPMKNFPWELWSAFLNKSQLQQLCSSTLSLSLLYQFLVPVEFQENFAQIVFLKCHVLCSTCRPETVRTSGFLLIWQTRHWIHNPKANS